MPTKVTIVAQKETKLPTISGVFPETEMKSVDKRDAIWNNTGSVVTLDDPRFGRENYAMGLWKPVDFLNQAEGGLFFLQEYQQNKLPVILVHGVNGGPLDWENVITGLNKEHFQPLVAYYPSGLRLDMISDYLVEAITMLQEKHGFSDYAVVAHSMGGLVTRSFVKKYVRHSKENSQKLKLVMTVNSPMAGMSAAAAGVEHSPIVVPSWRDVEPNSEFLKDLHTWEWPKDIPYHLVISYTDGKSSDGVVSLQSQSPMRLQSEATRMYIFNDDHVGTINNDKFIETLNMVLSTALTR
jgi:pimeloyl-ACP methyl ester carboxylesterase